MKLKNKFLIGILSISSIPCIISNAKSDIAISQSKMEDLETSFRGEYYTGTNKYSYTGDLSDKDGYTYEEGTIPILISAPHSIVQPKREGSYDNGYGHKSADKFTGTMAKILAEETGAHIIYKTRYIKGVDENYIDDNSTTAYRRKIKKICEENDIQLVIDLHGFDDKELSYSIVLGTNDSKNLLNEQQYLDIVYKTLNEHGFYKNGKSTSSKFAVDEKFKASIKNRTIANYSATTLKVPAIQIEFGSSLRDENNSKQFSRAVNTLIDIIENSLEKKAEVIDVKQHLNIRETPGTQGKKVGSIPLGEKASILGKSSNGWYKVYYKGLTGYSCGSNLKEIHTYGEVSEVSSYIYLRDNVHKDEPLKTEKVKLGEKVKILNEDNKNWYRVSYKNSQGKTIIGYAFKDYVKKV